MTTHTDGDGVPRTGADPRRWAVLAVGLLATTAGCAFQFGLAYLIPALQAEGASLSQAALLVACPTAGLLLTLVAWGAAADRWGERWVLAGGLGAAGIVLVLAATVPASTTTLGGFLLLAGALGAAVHASSGRLILGWFAASERGLAMGLRQTAQPLGVAVAALVIPAVAVTSTAPALTVLGVFCVGAAALAAVLVRDPERPAVPVGAVAGSPYRTSVLWRVHGASALLVVPQFTVATFALVFLVDDHGWSASGAGRLLAAGQVGGAVIRLAAGYWSDRVGSRLGPFQLLTGVITVTVGVLAVGAAGGWGWSPALLIAAGVVTVSTNGLAFTAVAEYAGRSWAGRALGIQNTGQNAVAALTPPIMAGLIAGHGYGAAFGCAAVFPLLAAALVPGEDPAPHHAPAPSAAALRRAPG
jgi:MFS family permease